MIIRASIHSDYRLSINWMSGWIRVFSFRKWSLIFYADIQNIYNYKALGPDELVPVENPDGSYRKDPDREGYYQMRSIKNELGGTVLPSVGVIVDF